jgi:hypothetical protein
MSPALFRSLALLTITAATAVVALNTHPYAFAQAPSVPGSSPTTPQAPAPAPAGTGDDNPRVEPGLVRWHASFAKAQEAARRSGKPVLLFHLMGQLDRQFC